MSPPNLVSCSCASQDPNSMTEPQASAAETEDVHTILSRMGMAMERRVHTLGQFLHQLNSSVQTPSQAVPRSDTTPQPSTPATLPPPVVSSPRSGTRFPLPKQFEGDPEVCRGFLTQCALGFQLQPGSFPTEESKVAYITTLLSGRALEWATAVWEKDLPRRRRIHD